MSGKRRMLMAASFIGLAGWMLFMMRQQSARIEKAIEESQGGPARWDPQKVAALMKEADAAWGDAEKALAAGNAKGAQGAYHRAVAGDLKAYLDSNGAKEVEPGVTLAEWVEKREGPFREKALALMDEVFERLKEGKVPAQDVKQMLDSYEYDGFKEPKARYEARKGEIIAARTKAAARWLRVEFRDAREKYRDWAIPIIEEKWGGPNGYMITFDPALSFVEQRCTWKTARIEFKQEDQEYVLDKENSTWKEYGRIPAIPIGASAEITIEGAADYPTSWDAIAPMTAKESAPERITIKPLDEEVNKAEELERENQAKLIASIKAQLEALPKFEAIPGADPAAVSLVVGDAVDLDAGRILALHDPPKLEGELRKLAKEKDPDVRLELMILAVQGNVDSLAPWVVEGFEMVGPERLAAFAGTLARNPWYGDGKPLASALGVATGPAERPVLEALSGIVGDPAFLDAALAKISQPKSAERVNLMNMVANDAPPESLNEIAGIWLGDADEQFARAAFVAFLNRDRALAVELTMGGFEKASEGLQETMLQYFKFPEGKAGQEADPKARADAAAILRAAALGGKTDGIKQGALSALSSSAHIPEAWDALQTAAGTARNDAIRRQLKVSLVTNVRRAQPEKAKEWLTQRLRDDDEEIRFLAMIELLGDDKLRGEAIGEIAGAVESEGADSKTTEGAMRAIQQFIRIRKEWDFSAGSPMDRILAGASRHPDAQTRRYVYTVMGHALAGGEARYAEALQSAAASEQDSRAREEIKRALAEGEKTGKKK